MLIPIRHLGFGLLLACTGPSAQNAAVELTPQQLFAGHSEGHGSLTIFLGKPQPFHVESLGQLRPDGSFQLDQTVTFEGQPAKDRSWILRTVSPGVYAGTLSDAVGDVSGRSEGNRLTLRYRIKSLLSMHQTLELMSDGRTIDNIGKITLLGIPVGWLDETIVLETPIR
ncbi:MAG TPA: DUF3833 family protein [Dokdonella sp.]|uniref:DUF3833 family protein n=1 Tax=Dokdonella sp. TaxID=2291710 RepID=UPI002D7F9E09|nr:DUF3833 family protein [Dokdonella sp.]HET9033777.1 DUF3833 family protein [Dokdonella sp.]